MPAFLLIVIASSFIRANTLFKVDSEDAMEKYIMINLESIPTANLSIPCYDYQHIKVVIKINVQWHCTSDADRNSIINYAISNLADHFCYLKTN